jgi:Putative addiction module component
MTSRQAKAHQRELFDGEPAFDTVKPEQLIERILAMSAIPSRRRTRWRCRLLNCYDAFSLEFKMEVNEIVQEALRLPAEQRVEILELITQSLGTPDPEVDRLWVEEAVRRLGALRAGQTKTYSMDEVFGKD